MSMVTRRQFIKLGLFASASLMLPKQAVADPRAPGTSLVPQPRPQAWSIVHSPARGPAAFYQSPGLAKFVQPLRGVGPGAIPVAVPDKKPVWGGARHYTIDINQYQDQLHPNLGPTTLWGYNPRNALGVTGVPAQKHLGGIIVAEKDVPVQITFQNNLPNQHILPVDPTIMGVMGNQMNRTCVHLHGGLVPWISDGGPFAWFDNAGNYGDSVKAGPQHNIYKILNPQLQGGQAEVYYPNHQSARMMWYHDHAVGITRLNAYAGIATGYIIRDNFERGLRQLGLPDFIENGGREIPLVFQDKIFVGADIHSSDPGWTGLDTPGSLWYPHQYETDRWMAAPGTTQPAVSEVAEMFGDTMLVNGVVHPFAQVEPRRYRLRILDACQARFLNLQLYVVGADGQPDFSSRGPDFLVIGTEGGFLGRPVLVPSNQPLHRIPSDASPDVDAANHGGSLLTAPAERLDVIVDFKGFEGKSLMLYNDAPAPFPSGDEVNDYQDTSPTGHNTRTIMRFDVAGVISGAPDLPLRITPATSLGLTFLSGMDRFQVPLNSSVVGGKVQLPSWVRVRPLTLNEVFDEYGRLIQMLGTNQPVPMPAGFTMDPGTPDAPHNYGRSYDSPATEVVYNGTTEVWQIANLTGDTHPMHFHLVNVQLLARQSFTADDGTYQYGNGVPTYTKPARGPEPTEMGWKETVRMNPGEVTTVMMKFNLPQVPFQYQIPPSPRTGGHEYVWHCHILDHEEHDMMRPLIVKY
jgi:spore coat protein A